MSISFAYHTITWRDNFSAALRDIAQAGFHAYETFSFPPRADDTWHGYVDRLTEAYKTQPETYLATNEYRSPDELKMLSAQHNLTLTSMYCSGRFIDTSIADDEVNAIINAAKFIRTLGCQHLVIGGGMNMTGEYTSRDYDLMFEALHNIGSRCREMDVHACYHPHSGTMVETPDQLDLFCRETTPELIALAPDVAHIVRGGGDPVTTVEQYIDRIKYIHLKDILDDEFVELGEGTIDLKGVMEILKCNHYTGWAVIEQDDTTRSPLDSAIISRRYLEDQIGVDLDRPE